MYAWHYTPAADLALSPLARLARVPREPDLLAGAARTAAAVLIRGWARLYHRFTVVGREHLPATGSFVMVANHASHLDAPALLAALPLGQVHRAYPAAAADYFFRSVPRVALSALVCNAMPFDRRGHAAAGRSLALCRQLLARDGHVLILFPEGTRSTSGAVGPFRRGVGELVAGTDLPVVPCHLAGAFDAWRKGTRIPRPRRLTLTIGRPRTYGHLRPGKASALAICHDLRAAVLSLDPARQPSDRETTPDITGDDTDPSRDFPRTGDGAEPSSDPVRAGDGAEPSSDPTRAGDGAGPCRPGAGAARDPGPDERAVGVVSCAHPGPTRSGSVPFACPSPRKRRPTVTPS